MFLQPKVCELCVPRSWNAAKGCEISSPQCLKRLLATTLYQLVSGTSIDLEEQDHCHQHAERVESNPVMQHIFFQDFLRPGSLENIGNGKV